MRLAIVGSRFFKDKELAFKWIEICLRRWGQPEEIVSGGAEGADALAELYADEHGIPKEIYNADWGTFPEKAGRIRNTKVVKRATHMIAFVKSDSVGTWDAITKARSAGLVLEIAPV